MHVPFSRFSIYKQSLNGLSTMPDSIVCVMNSVKHPPVVVHIIISLNRRIITEQSNRSHRAPENKDTNRRRTRDRPVCLQNINNNMSSVPRREYVQYTLSVFLLLWLFLTSAKKKQTNNATKVDRRKKERWALHLCNRHMEKASSFDGFKTVEV